MKRRVLVIMLSTVALISLLVFFNIYQLYQIASLQKSNEEYQRRLDNLEEENEKLKNQLTSQVSDVSANIVTRLGAKLFEGGVKDIHGTISNYIWMKEKCKILEMPLHLFLYRLKLQLLGMSKFKKKYWEHCSLTKLFQLH